MLMFGLVGFLTALIGCSLFLREKVRSWISGFISGTLSQILGMRLSDMKVAALSHDLASRSFVDGCMATILGACVGAAVILGTAIYVRWRKLHRKAPGENIDSAQEA
jgi:drug/metabolite transporter (DMT)-like permease